MATNFQTPSLLTLPIELRNIIYSELLSSKRSEPLILYDSSKGREVDFDLHPSILRSNKQIHAEAISYLYKKNIFQLDLARPFSGECDGGYYSDHKRPILPLFRYDDAVPTAVLENGECDDRPRRILTHVSPHSKRYRDCRCHLPPLPGPGPIYPHVLRRLAHIELITGGFSMCGMSKDGAFLTHIGKVVLDILRLLAEEEIEQGLVTMKTLRVEVQAKWVPDNLFLGDGGPWLSRKEGQALRVEMLALLKEIRRRRVVVVKEAVLIEGRGPNETKTVDIDTGEALEE